MAMTTCDGAGTLAESQGPVGAAATGGGGGGLGGTLTDGGLSIPPMPLSIAGLLPALSCSAQHAGAATGIGDRGTGALLTGGWSSVP